MQLQLEHHEPSEKALERVNKPGLSDYMRGIAGAGAAFGLIARYGGELLARAALQPHKKPWQGNHAPSRAIPKQVAYYIDKICREQILGIRTRVRSTLPAYASDERVVVYGNHPSSNAVFSTLRFATENIQPEVVGVGKKDLLRLSNLLYALPMAWPCKLTGNMIFVDRENAEKAVESIREGCKTVFRPGSMAMLFPDGHRPKPKNIADDHKKFAGKIPDIEKWQLICPPRYTGLYEMLKATEGTNRRVVRLFTSIDRVDNGKLDAAKLRGSTLHLHADDVTDEIPKIERFELRDWLMDDFWKMHEKRREILNGS